jgi:3-deoxy-D-manno-octulosonic-acid transferase
MESELWPTLLDRTRRSGADLVLVNARLSPRSYRAWRRFPALAARLLDGFSMVLAQSPQDLERFRALGAADTRYPGNLKFAAAPLAADAGMITEMKEALGGRPCWLAASTHPGEEDIAAEVHEALLRQYPDLLTMIVPRHPERGSSIAEKLASRGHSVTRRSLNQAPDSKTGIFLGDTIGDLGLFYRLSETVFIGGSLTAKGGQNPIEPAKLDCAILCGPNHGNFEQIVTEMAECGAMELVRGSAELGDKLGLLLESRDQRAAMCRSASRYVGAREGVLQETLAALSPFLDRLVSSGGPASAAAGERAGRTRA